MSVFRPSRSPSASTCAARQSRRRTSYPHSTRSTCEPTDGWLNHHPAHRARGRRSDPAGACPDRQGRARGIRPDPVCRREGQARQTACRDRHSGEPSGCLPGGNAGARVEHRRRLGSREHGRAGPGQPGCRNRGRDVSAERTGAALGRSVIAMGTAVRGVGSAVRAGTSQFTNLNFGVTSVTGAFRTAVGEVLKTTAALGALPATLFALAKSAASTASEVRNNALAAGTSTSAYQEFAAAAGKLGGEQEQLAQAFAVIQDHAANLQRAITDSEKANRRFFSSGTPSLEEMSRHYAELREKVANAGGAFERYGIAVTEAGGEIARSNRGLPRHRRQHRGDPRSRGPRGQGCRSVRRQGRPAACPIAVEGQRGHREDRAAAPWRRTDPVACSDRCRRRDEPGGRAAAVQHHAAERLDRPPVCTAVHRGSQPLSQGDHRQPGFSDHVCGGRGGQNSPGPSRSRATR